MFDFLCYSTPLHRAVQSQNDAVFTVLLAQKDLELELRNMDGHTALWLAVMLVPPGGFYGESSFAARLLKQGSSPNAINNETGRVGVAIGNVGGATGNVGVATGNVGGATGNVDGATNNIGGATNNVGGVSSIMGGPISNVGVAGSSWVQSDEVTNLCVGYYIRSTIVWLNPVSSSHS